MDCFSFVALAWDLVSSVGLQHTTAMEGQRNLLDFRFQVKGSVSPIHTKLLMIALLPYVLKGRFPTV